MLDLKEVKTWLRLEESDTSEDALLQSLIGALRTGCVAPWSAGSTRPRIPRPRSWSWL